MLRVKVRDVMTTAIAVISPKATIEQAETLLREQATQEVYIIENDGALLGVAPDYEFLKHRRQRGRRCQSVTEIMFPVSISLSQHDLIDKALMILSSHIHDRVPVVEEGRLLGLISRSDLLSLFAKVRETVENSSTESHEGSVPPPKLLRFGDFCRTSLQDSPQNP